MTEPKFRHEYKFFISFADYIALRARLKAVAKQDCHVAENGTYIIRSLYFDNVYDRALRQKIDGVNRREKFRIRCYNNDEGFVRLEKKSKVNGLTNKISEPITKDEAQKIISGDVGWMATSKKALIIELYSKLKSQLLRPKVIVEYTREPYIYEPGNVRITFDSKLKTGLRNVDMFDFDCPTVCAEYGTVLMEVKYDEFLPSVIRDILQVDNRRGQAFSKYCACRMYD